MFGFKKRFRSVGLLKDGMVFLSFETGFFLSIEFLKAFDHIHIRRLVGNGWKKIKKLLKKL